MFEGKDPLSELLERSIVRMVKGQYFQKKVKDRYRGAIKGRALRSILVKDLLQFGLLDSLQRCCAMMVDL